MGIFKQLFGKKTAGPGLDVLEIDLHSHLIPGIDDGAKDLADSLALVRGLADLGYRKCITTPHIMSDAFRNTPEIILGGLETLREALKDEGIEVEIEAAAEYYLDEAFLEKIESEELMSFGGEKKYVLFETSYVAKPMSLEGTIFKLKAKGYTPVLAHPERYQYFWELKDVTPIAELRERGALMQVNLTSFAGTRGKRASWIAESMVKHDLVDFVGTDIHRTAQLEALRRSTGNRALQELLEGGKLLNKGL